MAYSLITGASGGIGYELTRLFAKDRHNLILISRNEKKLLSIADELAKSYQVDILTIVVDVSKEYAADNVYGRKKKSYSGNDQ